MTIRRASGSRRARGETLSAELEPVRLRLVAAEEQHRPVRRRRGAGREAFDVDRVREDLPGPARLSEERSEERLLNALW